MNGTDYGVHPHNWLFLRGLAREARHWGRLAEVFARRVPGASVLCLDLPGAGSEARRPSPLSMGAIVEDLRQRFLAARRERAGDWSILSISLGGMLAMDWCTRYPSDFQRAVLINTSARNVGLPHERFSLRMVPSGWRIITASSLWQREQAVFDMTCNVATDREATINAWVEYARHQPMGTGAVLRQLLAALRFRAPRRLPLPVLVVSALKDRLVSPACSARLAQRLGATIVTHPTAGHDLSHDDPTWIADQVAAFASVTPEAQTPVAAAAG